LGLNRIFFSFSNARGIGLASRRSAKFVAFARHRGKHAHSRAVQNKAIEAAAR
jgi:hypothetical protein